MEIYKNNEINILLEKENNINKKYKQENGRLYNLYFSGKFKK